MAGVSVVQTYPLEHRNPPTPLVGLFGNPEYQKEVADYFIAQHRPPIFSHTSNEAVEPVCLRLFGRSTGLGCGAGGGAGPPSPGSWLQGHWALGSWPGQHRTPTAPWQGPMMLTLGGCTCRGDRCLSACSRLAAAGALAGVVCCRATQGDDLSGRAGRHHQGGWPLHATVDSCVLLPRLPAPAGDAVSTVLNVSAV